MKRCQITGGHQSGYLRYTIIVSQKIKELCLDIQPSMVLKKCKNQIQYIIAVLKKSKTWPNKLVKLLSFCHLFHENHPILCGVFEKTRTGSSSILKSFQKSEPEVCVCEFGLLGVWVLHQKQVQFASPDPMEAILP